MVREVNLVLSWRFKILIVFTFIILVILECRIVFWIAILCLTVIWSMIWNEVLMRVARYEVLLENVYLMSRWWFISLVLVSFLSSARRVSASLISWWLSVLFRLNISWLWVLALVWRLLGLDCKGRDRAVWVKFFDWYRIIIFIW